MTLSVAKTIRRLFRAGLLLCFLIPTLAEAQTRLVKDIAPGPQYPYLEEAVFFNGKLYFSSNDGTNGSQLWVSDSTPEGTTMLKHPCAGSCPLRPGKKIEFNGVLYFLANTRELWRTDGTPEGTSLVRNFSSEPPSHLTSFGGTLYFVTNEPQTVSGPLTSIWKTDGTNAGTTIIATFARDSIRLAKTSAAIYAFRRPFNPPNPEAENDTIYILTPSGVTQVDKSHSIYWESGGGTATIGDALYTLSGASGYVEIKKRVGASGTTSSVVVIPVDSDRCPFPVGGPGALVASGDTVFFDNGCSTAGRELWKTDGTQAGTGLVKDICPGTGGGRRDVILWDVNGTLYFAADDCVHGIELWKSDGTEAGTVMVKDIKPGSGHSFPAKFVASGSELVFQADDGSHGIEMWKSDGFSYGTTMVQDIEPGSGGGEVYMITPTPLGIFFSPASTSIGYALRVLPTLPMYRLYSDITKEHLYTTDANEDVVLGGRGWQREGVAYRIFPNAATPFEGVTPTALHRLYHSGSLQHLWTVDAFEAQALPSFGWVYEGVVGYILPRPVSSSIPLYRMSYASPLLHLWTIDFNEYTTLNGRGWAPEGPIGQVIP